MTISTHKDQQIKLRIDAPTLKLMERAKNYLGTNKSKFIRESIREKATSIIAAHEKTTFSKEDWGLFFQVLDDPIKTSERFKRAAKTHKMVSTHVIEPQQ